MRVGLEDIDVTSCLNVCIVVILLTSPPPVALYGRRIGGQKGGGRSSLSCSSHLSKKSWSRLSNKDNNNELLCQ